MQPHQPSPLEHAVGRRELPPPHSGTGLWGDKIDLKIESWKIEKRSRKSIKDPNETVIATDIQLLDIPVEDVEKAIFEDLNLKSNADVKIIKK